MGFVGSWTFVVNISLLSFIKTILAVFGRPGPVSSTSVTKIGFVCPCGLMLTESADGFSFGFDSGAFQPPLLGLASAGSLCGVNGYPEIMDLVM